MPRDLAYGAVITLKNARVGGGYLHSHYHLYPEGVGAKQQQMTAYAHKDENNKFLVKKWNEEPALFYTEEWSNAEVELVKHGDLVRLEHVMTRRNIHSHQQPAPVSKKQFQVGEHEAVIYTKKFYFYFITARGKSLLDFPTDSHP